jgi:hypothetical protein
MSACLAYLFHSLNCLHENEIELAPEPGTLALAAPGGASLLLFRRKK